jgi:hypothetical protein
MFYQISVASITGITGIILLLKNWKKKPNNDFYELELTTYEYTELWNDIYDSDDN